VPSTRRRRIILHPHPLSLTAFVSCGTRRARRTCRPHSQEPVAKPHRILSCPRLPAATARRPITRNHAVLARSSTCCLPKRSCTRRRRVPSTRSRRPSRTPCPPPRAASSARLPSGTSRHPRCRRPASLPRPRLLPCLRPRGHTAQRRSQRRLSAARRWTRPPPPCPRAPPSGRPWAMRPGPRRTPVSRTRPTWPPLWPPRALQRQP
jgi:hypothetical protein